MAKQKQRALVPDVIDVGQPVNEDQQLVQQESVSITSWFGNLGAFFKGALVLEDKAKQRLAAVEQLQRPTTLREDEHLQLTIRAIAAEEKEVDTYWDISKRLTKLRNHVSARRGVAEAALDMAKKRANRLHNEWNEEQRRIADEENRKRQRAAEEEARQKREAEIAELERQAVEREEKSADLSDREREFVRLYASSASRFRGNGQQAANIAGYKDGLKSAARLVSLRKIQDAVAALAEAEALKAQAAAVAAKPLDVEPIDEVEPQTSNAYGTDRENWRGEVTDLAALVEAFRAGKHGIPGDIFAINQAALNVYARSLHQNLNRWPGVKAVRKTQVV